MLPSGKTATAQEPLLQICSCKRSHGDPLVPKPRRIYARLLRLLVDMVVGLLRLGTVGIVFLVTIFLGGGLALLSVDYTSDVEGVVLFAVGSTVVPIGLMFGFVSWVAPQLISPPLREAFESSEPSKHIPRRWDSVIFVITSVTMAFLCSNVLPDALSNIVLELSFSVLALIATLVLVLVDGRRIVLLWLDYVLTSIEIALY